MHQIPGRIPEHISGDQCLKVTSIFSLNTLCNCSHVWVFSSSSKLLPATKMFRRSAGLVKAPLFCGELYVTSSSSMSTDLDSSSALSFWLFPGFVKVTNCVMTVVTSMEWLPLNMASIWWEMYLVSEAFSVLLSSNVKCFTYHSNWPFSTWESKGKCTRKGLINERKTEQRIPSEQLSDIFKVTWLSLPRSYW